MFERGREGIDYFPVGSWGNVAWMSELLVGREALVDFGFVGIICKFVNFSSVETHQLTGRIR